MRQIGDDLAVTVMTSGATMCTKTLEVLHYVAQRTDFALPVIKGSALTCKQLLERQYRAFFTGQCSVMHQLK